MAYGEALPTDSASKKFEGVVVNNGGANEMVAKAGVNRRTQNAEIVADQVVDITTISGAGAVLAQMLVDLYASWANSWPDTRALKPSTDTDQAITVTTAVIQFSPLSNGTCALISTETGYVRVTFDGSDPSATNGNLMTPGTIVIWSKETIAAAKFYRAAVRDAVMVLSSLIAI